MTAPVLLPTPGQGPPPDPPPSWRERTRRRPVAGLLWRAGVFLAGLLCVAAGLALSVLPGPLTIPPVLLGLYLWSTEFGWARRLFVAFRIKGRAAWAHARRYPVGAVVVSAGGLLAGGAALWAVGHYHLMAWALGLVGA